MIFFKDVFYLIEKLLLFKDISLNSIVGIYSLNKSKILECFKTVCVWGLTYMKT